MIMKDDDEVEFLVEHDEEMKNFFITISSKSDFAPEELAACLRSLAADIEKDPKLFLKGFSAYNFDCH